MGDISGGVFKELHAIKVTTKLCHDRIILRLPVSQELGALGGEAAFTVKGSHSNFTTTLPCLLSGVNIESIPQVDITTLTIFQ